MFLAILQKKETFCMQIFHAVAQSLRIAAPGARRGVKVLELNGNQMAARSHRSLEVMKTLPLREKPHALVYERVVIVFIKPMLETSRETFLQRVWGSCSRQIR